MARWRVQRPGAAAGEPVDPMELRAAWQRGEIAPGTLVCAEGHADWVPFHTVADLVAVPGANAPPVPSPRAAGRSKRGLVAAVVVGLLGVLMLGALLFIKFGRANAMTICKGLEARAVAKGCAPMQAVENGEAAAFVTVSTGAHGRVLVMNDNESYTSTLFKMNAQPEVLHGDIAFWAGGGDEQPELIKPYSFIVIENDIDTTDDDEIESFMYEDVKHIEWHQKPEPRPAPEHPVRSETCRSRSDGTCSGAGLCSVLPSKPANCIAGFARDCRVSTSCIQAQLCKPNQRTGMCEK